MKKRGIGILAACSMALLLVGLLSAAALATGGIAVGPSELVFDSVVRGGEYEQVILVFNPGDAEASYAISAEGDAGPWLSFWKQYAPDASADAITIPAASESGVLVKTTVPDDASNGRHEATIVVTSAPAGGGSNVGISASADVVVTVTGTQVLSGLVSLISAEDIEVDYPLRIKVSFKNTGNVVATPQIDAEISDGNGLVDRVTYAGTTVKVGKLETIPVEWTADGKQPGDYLAHVVVSLGGETIEQKDLKFAILPLGALSRNGTLTGLSLEGETSLGSLVTIMAGFRNTGQIDTRAKFLGEVYCDGELVSTVASEEYVIPVAGSDALKSYVTLETAGEYLIEGVVNYEGRKTEVKEVSFVVTGDAGRSGLSPLVIGLLAGLSVLATVAVPVALKIRQRWSQ